MPGIQHGFHLMEGRGRKYAMETVLASLPLAIPFLRSVSKILWATGLKAWLSVYTGMFGRSRITLLKKNFESLHVMNHGNGKWQYPFYMLLKFLLTCVVTISDTYIVIYFISVWSADGWKYCATSCPAGREIEEMRLIVVIHFDEFPLNEQSENGLLQIGIDNHICRFDCNTIYQ